MAKLHFYFSAMNAGKSTVLLQSNYNYKERGMKTLIFAPSIDTRYGAGKITSRIGLQAAAEIINPEFDIFEKVEFEKKLHPEISCVLIDEAHFLSKQQVWQLTKIVDQIDIPVLAYGIRTDFQGEPFPGSLYLLALADQLIEIKTICHCGSKATMNMRIDSEGQKVQEGAQVQIGGNDMYIATCRKHFSEGNAGQKKKSKSQHKQTCFDFG